MLLNTKTDVKRSGMILLIVVAFLSMFLVVGTTYLLVADSIRRTSDFDLNATDKRSDYALMPDIDPRYMFNFALGQILYDVADPVLVGGKVVTTNSALRGHSLARDIYGGYILGSVNDRPFQGMGKDTAAELNGSPNYIVVGPTNGIGVRDPEKGIRTTANPNSTKISSWNPPYTYPDRNHLYLGSYTLKSDGTTLPIKPSFFFDNVTNLRPPLPNNPPEFDGYDVKNLEGYPGGNDSIWIDAGFPVMTTSDGRKYKALIAPLILDLDGRINLNVAGNLMQRDGANPYSADHASNQGWGRWEINPKKLIENYTGTDPVYSPLSPANEFLNLLSFGTTSGNPATTFPPPMQPPNPPLNQWKTYGRFFKADYLPININPPPVTNFSTTIPHSYAQVDFNAAGDCVPAGPMGNPPKNWGLSTTKPTFVNANGFPSFGNGNGFGNGQATEYLFDGVTPGFNYHARNFNPYRTQSSGNDVSTVFPVSETASILRWQGKGEPFTKSQLAQLLPKSLGLDMPYANAGSGANPDAIFRQRIRNMVTTLSADLDRPAMVPIDVDVNTDPASRFTTDVTYGYPVKVGTPRPMVVAPVADTPTLTINRTTPALKLNLNRTLTNYPAYNINEGAKPVAYDLTVANVSNQYAAALTERQDFARDIFDYLKNVTGVAKMGSPKDLVDFPLGSLILADPEVIKVNRWLAQLAVNIVDFIDNDDFNTQFQWDVTTPARSKEFLFGIEMPRLVINEVFVQARNPDGATDGASAYEINTVVELLNPLPADTNSDYVDKSGSHTALLQYDGPVAGAPILNYKLSLIKRGNGAGGTTTKTGNLKDEIDRPKTAGTFETKFFGDLDDQPITMPMNAGIERISLGKWHGASTFKEINPSAYYKVGDSKTTDSPLGTATGIGLDVSSMDLDMVCLNNSNPPDGNCPQVVLQRLAVPGLPPEPNPASANFNPYITVDVFSKGKMNDARKFHMADNTPNPNFEAAAVRKSVERKTPFLDNKNQAINFDAASSDNDDIRLTGNSLGAINSNATGAPMMMHLDRALINPLELINVPCCFPHEFTQRANRWNNSINYMGFTAYPYAHNWPWFDENTRLYRFLEAVGVSPLQAGEAMHGRALGKVNVNTMVSDSNEVFQAVADASVANNFTSTDVTNGHTNLIGQRPILSFGQANYTDGMALKNGLNRSLMGYIGGNKPNENFLDVIAFNAAGPNVATYARKELLTKIGNSVTTKSNVFAVWITTGYFEVTNDTTQPPTLGLEIGKADGINIRHRMFAIVDRTNMVNAKKTDLAVVFNTNVNGLIQDTTGAPLTPINLGKPVLINPANNANINLVNGMTVTIDANTDWEETVSVVLDGNGDFLFTPQKLHNWGYVYPMNNPNLPPISIKNTIKTIVNRGNPGPWVGYDRTKDRDVVPYAEIIE